MDNENGLERRWDELPDPALKVGSSTCHSSGPLHPSLHIWGSDRRSSILDGYVIDVTIG
jgi:hypothetical protein